jgi:hypothetical protein
VINAGEKLVNIQAGDPGRALRLQDMADPPDSSLGAFAWPIAVAVVEEMAVHERVQNSPERLLGYFIPNRRQGQHPLFGRVFRFRDGNLEERFGYIAAGQELFPERKQLGLGLGAKIRHALTIPTAGRFFGGQSLPGGGQIFHGGAGGQAGHVHKEGGVDARPQVTPSPLFCQFFPRDRPGHRLRRAAAV